MMKDLVRWGIIGTGKMARRMAKAVKGVENTELVGIGSRDFERARHFAKEFDLPLAYGSYAELMHDHSVDVVYIATPNAFHFEHTVASLEAGKHVLCEKPFAVNAVQAKAMIHLAREKKLFLMEGMYSRFLPAWQKARELVDQGAIGKIRMVEADYGLGSPFDPQSRLYSPGLGGGALLDEGVYPVNLTSWFLDTPVAVRSTVETGPTGVDHQCCITLKHKKDALAMLYASIEINSDQGALLSGTVGRLVLRSPFFRSQELILSQDDQEDQYIACPIEEEPYHYEVQEVANCIRKGKGESPVMPLDETLAIMETLDLVRLDWGKVGTGERV